MIKEHSLNFNVLESQWTTGFLKKILSCQFCVIFGHFTGDQSQTAVLFSKWTRAIWLFDQSHWADVHLSPVLSSCHLDIREFSCARVSFGRHVHLHLHSLRTWEVAWENDESKQQQKELTQNGNSCPRIKIVFLDQYSWSKNGQIMNKVDKKVSFKSHSQWIF